MRLAIGTILHIVKLFLQSRGLREPWLRILPQMLEAKPNQTVIIDPPMPSKFEEIRASTQHALIGFLQAELNIGATFVQSAKLSLSDGHTDHYIKAKENSLKAIETIKKFRLRVTDIQVREGIQDRLTELERLYTRM